MTRTLLQAFARLDTETPDAALLERSRSGDADAFARIVARHGPMVFAIARRILGSGPDAEDAFQATFLVLFRRLRDLRQPENLAGWLFGVAQRTATDARRSRMRREERLKGYAATDRTPADRPDADLPELVQRELAALPDHYRVPIALCDLDGRSRTEAAALLKIPEGTLSSRLNTGRKRLAGRFAKLGYASAALGIVAEAAAARTPIVLPNFDPAGIVSPAVQTLVEGATRMLSVKTHLLTWGAVACCVLAFVGGTAIIATAQVPATPVSDPFAAPKPAAKPADEPDKPGEIPVKNSRPVVVKTIPEAGSDAVDPTIKEVRVTFSKKMEDGTWSWASDTGFGADLVGTEKPAYDKDGKTCVLPVKLAPNTTYAVWLNVGKFMNFKDTQGSTAVPYLLVFRTGKGK